MHHNPIIWTRPANDWDSDKLFFNDCLAGVGQVRSFPSTKIIACSNVSTNGKSPKICLITSKKTISLLAKNPLILKALEQSPKVYCLTKSQEEALVKQGITHARSTNTNHSHDMCQKVVSQNDVTNVWVVGAAELAFDSVSFFKNKGYPTDHIVLYKSVAETNVALGELCDLKQNIITCFASPSAAKYFAENLGNKTPSKLTALCIGETTAAEAKKHFKKVKIMSKPSLEALAKEAMILNSGES